MSTPETQLKKVASDEEDFKASISFLDVTKIVRESTPSTEGFDRLAHNMEETGTGDSVGDGNVDDDDGDSNSAFGGYTNWDNDDGFMDDNLSRVGSDYGGYSTSESTNFYASPHPHPNPNAHSSNPNANPVRGRTATASVAAAGAAPSASGPGFACFDPCMRETKYCSSEMLLRPPSTTMLSYNYPPARNMPPPLALPHAFVRPPAQTSSSSATEHGHERAGPGMPFRAYGPQQPPNMWYPNAPYGSGGGGGGGFGPYGAHNFAHHYNAPGGYPPDHPMMDMLQLTNSGREARNRAEKNRRDKLNGSIQELSTMVPHVAESPRRVDKTAVLRFAAHGLRLQYVFGDTLHQSRPQVTDTLMKLLDSFFITLTCHGQIVLISASIEQHLGHCQADLYGQNILHIAHPEDHNLLKQELIPSNLERLFEMHPPTPSAVTVNAAAASDEDGDADGDGTDCRPRTHAEEEDIDKKLREDKRCFTVRLARASPRSEPTSYELVKLEGNFRRADWAPRGVKRGVFPSSLQLIRRTRGRDDAIPLHTISGNDIVLIAIARIVRPPKIVSNVMDNKLEYWTRHLIDGRIIDCDQRIGIVAGYMTSEVQNLSPFTFIHQDDVRWVIVALRQMYDCNSSPGESSYRLITRNGSFIYLQSKGFLEIDKKTNKVHSFLCFNTLLDEAEGRRRVDDMKKRFSVIIDKPIAPASNDLPASANPLQLEEAVLCLIHNLPHKSSSDDEHDALSPPGGSRATRTPPLSLVPPEASSVKSSISTSIKLINVTAGKRLREKQRLKLQKSTEAETLAADSDALNAPLALPACSCLDGTHEVCASCTAGAAVDYVRAMYVANVTSEVCHKRSGGRIDAMHAMSKRRTINAEPAQIGHTLNLLGRTLDEQSNVALELRDQCSKYEVPNTNQRIDEIMEEHQKQSEIYVNIKTEYELQLQSRNVDAITTNATATAVTAAVVRGALPPTAINEDDDGYHEEEGDGRK